MQKIIFVGAVVILMGAQSLFGAVDGRMSPAYRYRAADDVWHRTDLALECKRGNVKGFESVLNSLRHQEITLTAYDLKRYFVCAVENRNMYLADFLLSKIDGIDFRCIPDKKKIIEHLEDYSELGSEFPKLCTLLLDLKK